MSVAGRWLACRRVQPLCGNENRRLARFRHCGGSHNRTSGAAVFGNTAYSGFCQPVVAARHIRHLCAACVSRPVRVEPRHDRPVSGGLWPELFGTGHLGAIRSLTSPIAIFATAAAPVLFGAIIDAGFDFRAIAFCCVGFVSLAALLAFAAGRDTLSNSLGGDTYD